MHRRKLTLATVAAFAIGAAFAAQPTSLRADRGERAGSRQVLWNPGSASPMSAYDPDESVLSPPH